MGDIMEMDLQEVGLDMDWIDLVQDRVYFIYKVVQI
jgi:hypothetical protein